MKQSSQPGTRNDVQNNKRVNDSGVGCVVYVQHSHCKMQCQFVIALRSLFVINVFPESDQIGF